jgi:signal transduction histidine kinase
VNRLISAAIEELDAELEGIEVSAELPQDLTVHADAEAFRTCLRNLLTNAAKAVAAGDGAWIRVAARTAGTSTEVSVADDGIGFEPDEAARLFDKFYRPGDELRRRTKGTGLGLYIVRHLARLSGAEIACHSEGPGRGAKFTLRWPAAEVAS